MNEFSTNDESSELEPREKRPSPASLFDRFFEDGFIDPFSMLSPGLLGGRPLGAIHAVFPKVDVSETDTEIKVVANVPGIDPDKINIEVGDDYLSLSGTIEKETEEEPEKGKVYRYEREYGEFRREFSLPARVNKEGIVATAKNGVLTIVLPKSGSERKTKVRVEAI